MNYLKAILFFVILTIIFVAIGFLIAGSKGILISLLLAFCVNSICYWFSDKLILAIYQAKPVNGSDLPQLNRIICNAAEKNKIPVPKVYLIPEQSPNLFSTGRDPKHASVAVTLGILKLLDDEELEAVILHELFHINNRDTIINSMTLALAGVIAILSSMVRWIPFLGTSREDEGKPNILNKIALLIIAPVTAPIIQFTISRTREYSADMGAGKLCRSPSILANALRKLYCEIERIPMIIGTPATSSLFIINPFAGKLAAIFSTHPPIEKRIKILQNDLRANMERNPND